MVQQHSKTGNSGSKICLFKTNLANMGIVCLKPKMKQNKSTNQNEQKNVICSVLCICYSNIYSMVA